LDFSSVRLVEEEVDEEVDVEVEGVASLVAVDGTEREGMGDASLNGESLGEVGKFDKTGAEDKLIPPIGAVTFKKGTDDNEIEEELVEELAEDDDKNGRPRLDEGVKGGIEEDEEEEEEVTEVPKGIGFVR
jgi:hypothetical protein